MTRRTAQITASHGRHHWVQILDGDELLAVVRGRQTGLCVGDRVLIQPMDDARAVIEERLPRASVIQRSDERRTRLLAANVERAAIVLAGEPRFSEELLIRMMIALEAAGVELAVIANKSDRSETHGSIRPRLQVLRALGYPLFELSALAAPEAARRLLAPWLAGRTTLLLGESGMGKSTLVNALAPRAQARTQDISRALGAGRHTTTFSRLFTLPAETAADARIIDSPGFQTFGLWHLSPSERLHAMRDFADLIGRCRFKDCTHRDEPGCALRDAAEGGRIDAVRYRLFVRIDMAERAAAGV